MSLRQKVSVTARQKSNFYLLDQVTVLLGLVLSGQFARFLIPDVQNGWYLSVWASSGLFVFVLMRRGGILFPGLWLGGFLDNWLLGYSPFDALGFASGELLAAWISLRLLYRWAPDWRSLAYKTDFLLFLAFPVGLNGVLAGAWGLFWQQMFYQGPWHLAPALLLSNSCAVSFGVLLLGTNLLSWQKPWSWQRLLAEESSFWFFRFMPWLRQPGFSGSRIADFWGLSGCCLSYSCPCSGR